MKKENSMEAIYDARKLGGGKMVVLGLQHMFAIMIGPVTIGGKNFITL